MEKEYREGGIRIMSYQGYRVKIAGIEIPNMLIASGTYSSRKEPRIAGSWTDGYGKKHIEYHSQKRTVITFSIRERNLEEQKSIKDVFANTKNVVVEYWDDFECEYKTGVFDMANITVSHKKATNENVLYNATQFKLEER